MAKRIYTPEQKERKRLYDIEYRKKNLEKRKEQGKKYREQNKEKVKKTRKEYTEKNKDNKRLYDIEYREKNKEKIKTTQKEYYLKNKDKLKNNVKEYRENNKDKIKIHQRNRYKNDPLFRLTNNIRSLIGQSFRLKGFSKNSKTAKILGCSFEEFKNHIESLWEPWMNWGNYGNFNGVPTEPNIAWDIDHVLPSSSAHTEEELLKLNHYTNLKPLCSFTNRWVKINKLI